MTKNNAELWCDGDEFVCGKYIYRIECKRYYGFIVCKLTREDATETETVFNGPHDVTWSAEVWYPLQVSHDFYARGQVQLKDTLYDKILRRTWHDRLEFSKHKLRNVVNKNIEQIKWEQENT